MKTDNLILLAAVASAVFLWLNRNAIRAALASGQTIANGATAGQPGFGWQYFTGGTAISPEGDYYFGGSKVYDGVTVGTAYKNGG